MAKGRKHKRFAQHAGPTRGRHVALEGVLHVARPGSACVETSEGTFVVARGGLREGMDGDRASVTLVRRGSGEPQAFVQSVLERAHATFMGTFDVAGPLGVVVPLDERIRRDFFVLPDDKSAETLSVGVGDIVVARIVTYPARREAGVVTIERRVGEATGLDVPIERVIASHGLAVHFSEKALAEAEGLEANVAEVLAEQPFRKDLREELVVTVDPASARDFDDAVSCKRTATGGFKLGVHIADVSHYVPWESSLDLAARERTCSTYLVDRVLPMLPERLSNGVCSLNPGEDRLAMSVLIELNAAGEVRHAEATASAIRSKARLCYEQVDELLQGEQDAAELPLQPGVDPAAMAEMLRNLNELSHLRQDIRKRRGAIDFESVEAKVTLDEANKPTGVSIRRRTDATQLIEEAMLLANEAVADILAPREREFPCAFRVHEQPSPDQLATTLPALKAMNLLQPGETELLHAGDPFTIQAVLARAEGTSYEAAANMLILRAMKRAIYLPHNDGHYALGARAYCHFTSPIRRYPDVLVHRALKVAIGATADAGWPPAARTAAAKLMPQFCRTCSDREREADAAGYDSQKIKMAELMSAHIGESFSGIIAGVERYGLFVRLDDTCAEGLLPVRALGDEWFIYDEPTYSLTGESTGKRWYLGKRIAVTISACDANKGQIDFVLAGNNGHNKQPNQNKKQDRRPGRSQRKRGLRA